MAKTIGVDSMHDRSGVFDSVDNDENWSKVSERVRRTKAEIFSNVRNLKQYAAAAGIKHIHLHKTRHTYAGIVAEETRSLIETQDALRHESPKPTRISVQQIAIKKDKHSRQLCNLAN